MLKFIFVDYDKCVGCRICELICSFYHHKTFKQELSAIKVVKFNSISRDIPLVCEQCDDAPCKKSCPSGSIYLNESTGGYEINRDSCLGCKRCVMSCPFGVLTYDDEYRVIVKCDLCNGKPMCVELCPSEALSYKEASITLSAKRKEYLQKVLKT